MGEELNDELREKVLRIAAEICWMNGSVAGDRVCQDWSGETKNLDSLTKGEKNQLLYLYEQFNSNGEDYEEGYFPYDEMLISFVIARALEVMA